MMWKKQQTEPANEKTQREIHEHCEGRVDSLVCPRCDRKSVKANFKKNLEDDLQDELNEELEEYLEKEFHECWSRRYLEYASNRTFELTGREVLYQAFKSRV